MALSSLAKALKVKPPQGDGPGHERSPWAEGHYQALVTLTKQEMIRYYRSAPSLVPDLRLRALMNHHDEEDAQGERKWFFVTINPPENFWTEAKMLAYFAKQAKAWDKYCYVDAYFYVVEHSPTGRLHSHAVLWCNRLKFPCEIRKDLDRHMHLDEMNSDHFCILRLSTSADVKRTLEYIQKDAVQIRKNRKIKASSIVGWPIEDAEEDSDEGVVEDESQSDVEHDA